MVGLDGWLYYKELVLTGSTAGAQTNYQTRVTVHYGSGSDSGENVYCNSHCKTDFGDLRFARADGVQLDFCILSQVNGDYAEIWFEADSYPASPSTKTIRVHYGKSDATTTSHPQNTFPFFDDFGSNRETWSGGMVANGKIAFSTTEIFGTLRSSVLEGAYAVDIGWAFSTTTGAAGFFGLYNSAKNARLVGWARPHGANSKIAWDGDYFNGNPIISISWGTSSHLCGMLFGGTTSTSQFTGYVDATSANPSSAKTSTPLTGAYVSLVSTVTSYCNYFRVRKFVDPEPAYTSWGSEPFFAVLSMSVTVALSGSLVRQFKPSRTIVGGITLSGDFSRLYSAARGFVADSVLASSLSRAFNGARAFSASASLSAVVGRVFSGVRGVVADSSLAATFNVWRLFAREFVAGLSLQSSVGGRIVLFARSFVVDLNVEGSFSRFFDGVRSFAASSSLAGGFSRVFTAVRGFSASLGVSSSFIRVLSLAREFAVSAGLSSGFDRALSLTRQFAASMGLSYSVIAIARKKIRRVFLVGERRHMQVDGERKNLEVYGLRKDLKVNGER